MGPAHRRALLGPQFLDRHRRHCGRAVPRAAGVVQEAQGDPPGGLLPAQCHWEDREERAPGGAGAVTEQPGEFPYTRGISAEPRHWIMGQYAGFGTPAESNARFRALLDAGVTGFSVALDLPTQLGLDS